MTCLEPQSRQGLTSFQTPDPFPSECSLFCRNGVRKLVGSFPSLKLSEHLEAIYRVPAWNCSQRERMRFPALCASKCSCNTSSLCAFLARKFLRRPSAPGRVLGRRTTFPTVPTRHSVARELHRPKREGLKKRIGFDPLFKDSVYPLYSPGTVSLLSPFLTDFRSQLELPTPISRGGIAWE